VLLIHHQLCFSVFSKFHVALLASRDCSVSIISGILCREPQPPQLYLRNM